MNRVQRFSDRDELGSLIGSGGGGVFSAVLEVQQRARKNRIENLFDFAVETFRGLFPYEVTQLYGPQFWFDDTRHSHCNVFDILVYESDRKSGLRCKIHLSNMTEFVTGNTSGSSEAVKLIFNILEEDPDEGYGFSWLKNVSEISAAADAIGSARTALIRAHPADFKVP